MADAENEANGFIGAVFLYRGDGGSPETFDKVCSASAISGIGVALDLVDSTTFCSPGRAKQNIAGLADGATITVTCNFRADGGVDDLQQRLMRADGNVGALRAFELGADGDLDGAENLRLSWEAVCTGWTLAPSVDGKNSINFTYKITGPITEFYL